MTLVRAEDVCKTYMSGEVEVHALKGLSFERSWILRLNRLLLFPLLVPQAAAKPRC